MARWLRQQFFKISALCFIILCLSIARSQHVQSQDVAYSWHRNSRIGITHIARSLAEHESSVERDAGEEKSEGGEEAESAENEEGEGEEAFTPMDLTCGICLLSFITFNMTLYYLVNWPDPEMKIYVWTVISTTISIFIAIFIFSCTNLVLQQLIPPGNSMVLHALLSFFEVAVWFVIMQVTVAKISGALNPHPFDISPDAKSIKEQKIDRKISFKSISTLLAHVTGFAAINAGGWLQHMEPFNQSTLGRFSVPPLMFIGQLIISRVVRFCRLQYKGRVAAKSEALSSRSHGEKDDEASYQPLKPDEPSVSTSTSEAVEPEGSAKLRQWCLEQWDDETYEAEIDIAGLAISFLLVQASRFAITGIMPNNLGIEEMHYIHAREDTYRLGGVGVLFASLCVLSVVVHSYMPDKIQPGTIMSTVKRMVLTFQKAFAMALAWSLFTCSKWEIARELPQFKPNGVVSRVLLALELSVLACIAIKCLDFFADMDSTGEVADRAMITLIGGLSTLVGFSFEQSFDGAVEALADLIFKSHKMQAELILAIVVVLIVYPAWKWHILRTLINLKETYAETRKGTSGEEAAIIELDT